MTSTATRVDTPPAAAEQRRSGGGLFEVLSLAALVFLFGRVTWLAARPVSDPDTWWHLRLGEEFSTGWSLTDPGQLTPFATRPWFATQWLPEVVAWRVETWLGLPGVAWLHGVALVALVTTVVLVARREADLLPAAFAAAVCLFAAGGSLGPRPQALSFLFLAVTTGAWMASVKDGRPRWWLVALTWVWACTHGMWFTGVVLGAAVVLGLAVDRRLPRGQLLRLAAVPVASVAAAMLTPVGPKLLLAPLATSGAAPFVTEWAPPSFKSPSPALAALALALVVVTWARRGRPVPWAHVAVAVVAAGWILLSARTVALGAVMLTPLLAASMQSWLVVRRTSPTRRERWTLAGLPVICLAALAAVVPTVASAPDGVPTRFDDRLGELAPGTVVLNEYGLGGWLVYRHPSLAPVIDGMTDAYTVEYLTRYAKARAVVDGWSDYVDETGASVAVVESGSPIATALEERSGWVVIQEDDGFVLMEQPADG